MHLDQVKAAASAVMAPCAMAHLHIHHRLPTVLRNGAVDLLPHLPAMPTKINLDARLMVVVTRKAVAEWKHAVNVPNLVTHMNHHQWVVNVVLMADVTLTLRECVVNLTVAVIRVRALLDLLVEELTVDLIVEMTVEMDRVAGMTLTVLEAL